jgi:hemerythrin HHE cation binding domain-containing protein
MPGSRVRALLLAQHEELRARLASCRTEAGRVLAGEPRDSELRVALLELRETFAEHNETERKYLEPLLRRSHRAGEQRIARMLEEHGAEHLVMSELMAGAEREVAARMTDLAEDIEAHMAAEERTFLSPQVLDDKHSTSR